MRLDFDPSPLKAALIGIFLFLESLVGSIIIILRAGALPTTLEWMLAVFVALMVLITYVLVFLRLDHETQTY